MPIPVICPFCGARSVADDEHAGRIMECEVCTKPVTIPREQPLRQRPPLHQRGGVSLVAALVVALGIFAVGLLALIVWLLQPVVMANQANNHRLNCQSNLKQIALALHNYHDAHGSFPPAYLTDAKGKPMHSWRVLILPYLDESDVYDRYRFDEPWDGPNNSQLVSSMPRAYFCPEHPDPLAQQAGETNYMVVCGDRTMFPPGGAVAISDVTDGLARTVMVVETTVAGVNWMSPQDLSLDSMTMQINSGPTDPGSHHHAGGAHVALGDGSVVFLSRQTRSRSLYAGLTRDGGESTELVGDSAAGR